jgi:alpha-ribazole phosphatase
MIYLLRHGEIDNVEPKRFMGQTDVPLTDRGIEQAYWWRRQWSKIRFEGIWCSDLERSRQTAEIMREQFACPLKMTPSLREINLGEWDGMPVEAIRSKFSDEWAARGRDMAGYRPPGGESFADLQARIVPVFEEIARDTTGNVLITAHSGVNRVILCYVLNMPLGNLFRLGQDFSALNFIEYANGNFVVKLLNGMPEVQ